MHATAHTHPKTNAPPPLATPGNPNYTARVVGLRFVLGPHTFYEPGTYGGL